MGGALNLGSLGAVLSFVCTWFSILKSSVGLEQGQATEVQKYGQHSPWLAGTPGRE